MEAEKVFRIATAPSRVFELLASKGWESRGKDEGMEMDLLRNKKTERELFVEVISEDFAATLLLGELSLVEFVDIASELELLEVDSNREGKPTTILVAMTEEQVRNMFGKRTNVKKVADRSKTS